MKSVSFIVERVPLSLNVMLNMHWQKRKREQNIWDLLIYSHWMAKRKMVFKEPVRIVYEISFSSKRLRDYDNYVGGTKFINDALKRTFLTKDDHTMLKEIKVKFLPQGESLTKILIEEVNETNTNREE